ncbi:hypothetical protein ONZ45_g8639 [Pleurotus djamor]|nr:hypothetical protein ONZ45_g8639 [Pleurotus djamor]
MPGTHLLPPNLLKLFAPRPPLPYKRPVDKDLDRIRNKKQTLIASNGERDGEGMEDGEEPTFTLAEEYKRQLRREERRKKRAEEYKVAKEAYKPAEDVEAVGDPYKTLFISRLNKTATENDLRREFETYGTIERVRIVRDKKGRSRGYAFIVYERERDMKGMCFPLVMITGRPDLFALDKPPLHLRKCSFAFRPVLPKQAKCPFPRTNG